MNILLHDVVKKNILSVDHKCFSNVFGRMKMNFRVIIFIFNEREKKGTLGWNILNKKYWFSAKDVQINVYICIVSINIIAQEVAFNPRPRRANFFPPTLYIVKYRNFYNTITTITLTSSWVLCIATITIV